MMFPLPYRPPLDEILYALFALEYALMAVGFLTGRLNAEQTGRLPRPLRMLLSALLVIAAFLQWQFGARQTPVQTFAALIFLGMAAGFVGDLIMARLIRVPDRLIVGILAFSVGHLFYIAAFWSLIARGALAGHWTLAAVPVAVLTFCVWAWYTQVRSPSAGKVINTGSLFYGLLFGATATLAIILLLHDVRYLSVAIGVLSFMASEVILGNWVIRGHVWKGVNDVIWLAYVSGQMLIVYSVAAALNVLMS